MLIGLGSEHFITKSLLLDKIWNLESNQQQDFLDGNGLAWGYTNI